MKYLHFSFFFFFLLEESQTFLAGERSRRQLAKDSSLASNGSNLFMKASKNSLYSMPVMSLHVLDSFNHPGAIDSKAELDFVMNKILAGDQPWTNEYQQMLATSYATATPDSIATVLSTNDIQVATIRDNAFCAYTQALLWYFSGDELYAQGSIAILNSWSNLQGFVAGTDQDKLVAGWTGAVFAPAAEIMRLYSGWQASDISNLQAMFRNVYYPQLKTMSTWNGNVDLTQIDAMMAIAVFNDDSVEFNAGLTRLSNRIPAYFYLTTDGPVATGIAGDNENVPNFWSNPTKWVDGLMQETCRDNGHHAQFALGSAMHAMETAWHQGVDVYTGYQSRMVAALELLAQMFNTGSMQGVCGAADTTSSDLYDTWEVGYNHYHNRKGLALPNTLQLITNQIRPYAVRQPWGFNLVYETLTHADVSIIETPTTTPTESRVSTIKPTGRPSVSRSPTFRSSKKPTVVPSSRLPTATSSSLPSEAPTYSPTSETPTWIPSTAPKRPPTKAPTQLPTKTLTIAPTKTASPSVSKVPTRLPSRVLTSLPSLNPSGSPTEIPTLNPSYEMPSTCPSETPTFCPTETPTINPSQEPTSYPINNPTKAPTSILPSIAPSKTPTIVPSKAPTSKPTTLPSTIPQRTPTYTPSSKAPSLKPTISPSMTPTCSPSSKAPTSRSPSYPPSMVPTLLPSRSPSRFPSQYPTRAPIPPSRSPTYAPSSTPPTSGPSEAPTNAPTESPTYYYPTLTPTGNPSNTPSTAPSRSPTTTVPSKAKPTCTPSFRPTSISPTSGPSNVPTKCPSTTPTISTKAPTSTPTKTPSKPPSTPTPTTKPTTTVPTSSNPSSKTLSTSPTAKPSTYFPSKCQTSLPTRVPSKASTVSPSKFPSTTST